MSSAKTELSPTPKTPLCETCEERPALTEDGPILRCMACILRMADWVARPEQFPLRHLKNLLEVHGDLVDLLVVPDNVQTFVTPFGIVKTHDGSHLEWQFNEDVFIAGRIPPYAVM